MANPGTPDWWLNRLYTRLRNRAPQIRVWDDWYSGRHPVPQGYEDAEALFQRLMETVGLNMLKLVSDAPLARMEIAGFKVDGKPNDDVWQIWQDNNFDLGSELVRQEKLALSEAYVMVDPNNGSPILTPEHPEQCIIEYAPGSSRKRVAALKVWQDDVTGPKPLVRAFLDLGADGIHSYAAPTRVFAQVSQQERSQSLALQPSWEFQESESGPNPFGEPSIVAFPNGGRMLAAPEPEWYPALAPQRRINKTLLDRMAMQDQGAFKAMWATGIKIPRDPLTGEPVEKFLKAINRTFINENPEGKFGQLQAEDIKQMLEAVRDDIADCAMTVPTSADQILGKLVNVAGDGLKLAQNSEVKRTRRHIRQESEGWEDVARLTLIGAGKSVPSASRMTTEWANPEYRTDTEQANAATVAITAGMPPEVAWERYFNASPDDVKDWRKKADNAALDPFARQILKDAAGGNPQPSAGA